MWRHVEMSHLHVRLERPIRLLEVIEGLGLGREALRVVKIRGHRHDGRRDIPLQRGFRLRDELPHQLLTVTAT